MRRRDADCCCGVDVARSLPEFSTGVLLSTNAAKLSFACEASRLAGFAGAI
jgi:hypothetical protein